MTPRKLDPQDMDPQDLDAQDQESRDMDTDRQDKNRPAADVQDNPTLEDRLRRLDRIVAELEGGEVELEKGLALFEEGVRHIREAEALLARAELRVEELVGDGEGARTRPFQEDAAE
jgi:exodeoxyribonuclease VII small subunit